MERLQEILEQVNELPDSNNSQILKYIIGYMIGSHNGLANQTDGYIAFAEGMESGIIEYKDN